MQAAYAQAVPGSALIAQSMFWPVLLPEQKLSADAMHEFSDLNASLGNLGPVSHVRLNIIPDGGVSRIRVWGHPKKPERA